MIGISDWSRTYKRPVFPGEFGAYEKADSASRITWTRFIRETAEKTISPGHTGSLVPDSVFATAGTACPEISGRIAIP